MSLTVVECPLSSSLRVFVRKGVSIGDSVTMGLAVALPLLLYSKGDPSGEGGECRWVVH